jgi:hypothetical protein
LLFVSTLAVTIFHVSSGLTLFHPTPVSDFNEMETANALNNGATEFAKRE